MCGIAGFLRTEGVLDEVAHSVLQRMADAIVHRGPDHCGIYLDENVALVNQRLKILDLARGNQPIFNETNNLVIVYNGEIYNYRELRAELEGKGHTFRSDSDTEVVVHLFEEEGTASFRRLNGMFAFALWNRADRKLYLVRDRFGIKPLFYGTIGGALYFSSELRGLTGLPEFEGELDGQALSIYLAQLYIPQPWTIFKGIRRLRAGCFLEVSKGRLEERSYFDFPYPQKSRRTKQENKEILLHLLKQAVRRQLVSDVPVGMFLSSGVDSFAVLAMATDAGSSLDSFTLAFGEREYDEAAGARAAAEFFGSRHHTVLFSEADFLLGLRDRQLHSAEPLAPWINVGRRYLAQAAAEAGHKVMLSGAGGDEFFCGYPTVNALMFSRYYQRIPGSLRGAFQRVFRRLPAGRGGLPLSYMAKAFVSAQDPDSLWRTFFNFKAVMLPSAYPHLLTSEARKVLEGTSPYLAFEQYLPACRGWPIGEALLYLDIKTFLEGAVLFLGDNATMSVSVEERVPFLDHDLVDFAWTLPWEQLFDWRRVKPLLRDALIEHLNAKGGGVLSAASRKRGFELPGNRWARDGKFSGYLKGELELRRLARSGFFQPKAVAGILEEHRAGRQNHERLLQAVLGLEVFLNRVLGPTPQSETAPADAYLICRSIHLNPAHV